MASPTETKSPAEPEFDLLVFWIENKSKILLLAGLVAAALTAYGLFQLTRYRAHQAASRDFAGASSAEDYRRVLTDHAHSAAAGNAALLLAANLRGENKLEESSAVLQQMISQEPNHPLIAGAWMSLAANLELQKKTDEALATYQKIATAYPNSFSAPAALMAQARIFKDKGQLDDAQRAYDSVISQFADSLYARMAQQESQSLKK